MTIENITTKSIIRTSLIDLALLATACLIPIISHLTALPLYRLNPMLMVILAGLLLVNNRANAYLLCLLVPFVTSLATGMPSLAGALCMAIEFAVVVSLFSLFRNAGSFLGLFGAIALATVVGRIAYYAAKWLIVNPDTLVHTPILWQVGSIVAISALFALGCTALRSKAKHNS